MLHSYHGTRKLTLLSQIEEIPNSNTTNTNTNTNYNINTTDKADDKIDKIDKIDDNIEKVLWSRTAPHVKPDINFLGGELDNCIQQEDNFDEFLDSGKLQNDIDFSDIATTTNTENNPGGKEDLGLIFETQDFDAGAFSEKLVDDHDDNAINFNSTNDLELYLQGKKSTTEENGLDGWDGGLAEDTSNEYLMYSQENVTGHSLLETGIELELNPSSEYVNENERHQAQEALNVLNDTGFDLHSYLNVSESKTDPEAKSIDSKVMEELNSLNDDDDSNLDSLIESIKHGSMDVLTDYLRN